MTKLSITAAAVVVISIIVLGFLAYVSMTSGKEIPGTVIAVFSSLLSGIVGYEAGKRG